MCAGGPPSVEKWLNVLCLVIGISTEGLQRRLRRWRPIFSCFVVTVIIDTQRVRDNLTPTFYLKNTWTDI